MLIIRVSAKCAACGQHRAGRPEDRARTRGPLTVKTRDGMGVRSCGWIMERTEGRWPSLAPTKNSLRTQEHSVPSHTPPGRAGSGEGPCRRAGLPVGASRHPRGAPLARVSKRTQQRVQKDMVVLPPAGGQGTPGVRVGAHREDVKRDPLTEPKQDRPTKTGMIQDMTPRW